MFIYNVYCEVIGCDVRMIYTVFADNILSAHKRGGEMAHMELSNACKYTGTYERFDVTRIERVGELASRAV